MSASLGLDRFCLTCSSAESQPVFLMSTPGVFVEVTRQHREISLQLRGNEKPLKSTVQQNRVIYNMCKGSVHDDCLLLCDMNTEHATSGWNQGPGN